MSEARLSPHTLALWPLRDADGGPPCPPSSQKLGLIQGEVQTLPRATELGSRGRAQVC